MRLLLNLLAELSRVELNKSNLFYFYQIFIVKTKFRAYKLTVGVDILTKDAEFISFY